MRKILFAFTVLFMALTSCVKNEMDDINIDGNVYTEDFFIVNSSDHEVKLHYIPYEGAPMDVTLEQNDTVAMRSYGRGEILAAPFLGKLYISFEKDEWVPSYAYSDIRKDLTNPSAYRRKEISTDFYQSFYILEESDYTYWLKVKAEAEEQNKEE